MIEAQGVPHTEIDLILVNHESVGFSYIVQDGDLVSVYPVFESLDISSLNMLRPQSPRRIRFVLDTHLGKLAKYLRMLGFDALYNNTSCDLELATLASSGDKRILLTRDVGLLKYKQVSHGYFIRSKKPREQLAEVLDRFDLRKQFTPFRLCVNCNGVLNELEKSAVYDRVPYRIYHDFDRFVICESCQQIYWQGSHYHRMRKFMTVLASSD